MSAERRACPYEGCTKTIGRDLFACSRHWFTLPADVRDEIWRAFRAYDRGNGTLDTLNAAHERAYAAWGQT